MKKNIKIAPVLPAGTSLINKTGSWRHQRPQVNFNTCISCATCQKVCPEACVELKKIPSQEKIKPVIDYNYCKGCGLCAQECPVKAITMVEEKK